jgi:hypothetical protein
VVERWDSWVFTPYPANNTALDSSHTQAARRIQRFEILLRRKTSELIPYSSIATNLLDRDNFTRPRQRFWRLCELAKPRFAHCSLGGELMLRETAKRFKVLIVVLTLLSASVIDTRAESASIYDATAIEETASGSARRVSSTALKQVRQRNPCNAKRRTLAGAAVGAVIAMVAVRKAAEANDGTVGVKGTLQAGGYGAVLVFVGLKTCR